MAMGLEKEQIIEYRLLQYNDIQFEKWLNRSGSLYSNKAVSDYLKTVIDKIYPENTEKFAVKIIKSTDINAFVLNTGNIYINLGLLALAQNEAQVASVLAHEGAHFIKKHGLYKRDNLKHYASGVDFYGIKTTLGFMGDYSQELELEADKIGFEFFKKAQYNPNEAKNMFEVFAKQAKASSYLNESWYQSHPKIKKRIRLIDTHRKTKNGFIGRKKYVSITNTLVEDYLKLLVKKYRNSEAIEYIGKRSAESPMSAKLWFFLGKAHQQRNENGDNKKAEDAYIKSSQMNPNFAPNYYSLGQLMLKNKQAEKAKYFFQKYISLAADEGNIQYAKHIKDSIK